MNTKDFRRYGHELVDWMADYMDSVEQYPVKSQVKPGEIRARVKGHPPESGEEFEEIFKDFKKDIIPGMTHWQHPSFFAYFPATSSKPSVLAEMLTATLGAQCMMWITSPAAAELEEEMMEWLKEMLDLPKEWTGVIQDTASTATLCALLSAREKYSDFGINKNGFTGKEKFRIYASGQAHSSIEKDVKIAGFGSENLRKIAVDEDFAMIPKELQKAIEHDLAAGFTPLCIIAALGTTGSTAIDPIDQIGEIANKFNVWYHIDAAYAGSALIIHDFRDKFNNLESADSFVFNPHKWMFTNFDCTAYYVKDKDTLVNTFSATPEYLRTREENDVNNYKDWGIQLGRRFRALKLWFVIRYYGSDGIRQMIQNHIELGQWFADKVIEDGNFELLAPVPLNTVCFRYVPNETQDEQEINSINEDLMNRLNDSGELFLTHTKLGDKFALRMVPGQTEVKQEHVEKAWDLIRKYALG